MKTEKKQSSSELEKLPEGTPIKIKNNTTDPDFGHDISGWQGRISGFDRVLNKVCIAWDSITLKNIPFSVIQQCEDEGYDWKFIYLETKLISQAEAKDTEEDTEKEINGIVEQLFEKNKIPGFPYELLEQIKKLDSTSLFIIMNIWRELLAAKTTFGKYTFKHLLRVTGLSQNSISSAIKKARDEQIILTFDPSKLKMDRETWIFLNNEENQNRLKALSNKEMRIKELEKLNK